MSTLYEMLKKRGMLAKDGQHRSVKHKKTDVIALRAIIQAAINVEEFTIPLYMCAMYSIQGMHAITGKNDLYLGRLWPGLAPVSKPENPNETTFNQIFKVFIEEMLHLQMIANIATTCGIKKPCFTSPELMDQDTYGWTCYGDHKTIIPHVIDLRDLHSDETDFSKVRVKLDSLNKQQIELFLAIEASGETTEKNIKPDELHKYFPKAPFEDWEPSDDLPMFGSIGWLYLCLWKYIETHYDDGSSLWEEVYQCNALQRDLFNNDTDKEGNCDPNKPKEYPLMRAKIKDLGSNASIPDLEEAKDKLLDMISGITDQGEGQTVPEIIDQHLRKKTAEKEQSSTAVGSKHQADMDMAVRPKYQADYDNLTTRYPSYNDQGKDEDEDGNKLPSASAEARAGESTIALDHLEIFTEIKKRLSDRKNPITTWDQWHAAGKTWTPDMLKTDRYEENRFNGTLPSAEDVACALNRLKNGSDNSDNYALMSKASAGAIKGITTVLNDHWDATKNIGFPFPSMGGSGDRMSICWAVFGKAPNLRKGTPAKRRHRMYHACQGLKLDSRLPNQPDGCALVEVYHTCKGSNTCKGESGCGFIQKVGGGSSCSATKTGVNSHNAAPQSDLPKTGCEEKTYYSAPSANLCAGQGGCAVPISASQLHLNPGDPKPSPPTDTQAMSVFNIQLDDGNNTLLGHFKYEKPPSPDHKPNSPYYEGALVHDVAWAGYVKILKANGESVPKKPKPSDLRLAFPPST